MLLAADVGGTKTILSLFHAESGRLEELRTATYASARYAHLEDILDEFLGSGGSGIAAACFGIPGPVVAGRARALNLAWTVDAVEIAQATGIAQVELINDLFATASGVFALSPDEFATLQEGKPVSGGNAALVAPGTGLGVALLARIGPELVPLASEGGHMDFAPRNELEIDLLRYLQRRLGGRVSVERVLSGPGLVNLYEFLRDAGAAPELPEIRDAMADSDPGAVIGRAALAGTCELSSRALDLFVALLGATAGNLALLSLATSGVYLGGGIPPKILPRLQTPQFLEAFLDKGRFSGMLETFPVKVILNQRTALLGAARRALLRLGPVRV